MHFLGVETVFTIIEVVAYFTLKSWTSDGIHLTTIASNSLMTAWYQLHFSYHTSPITLLWEIHRNILTIATNTWNLTNYYWLQKHRRKFTLAQARSKYFPKNGMLCIVLQWGRMPSWQLRDWGSGHGDDQLFCLFSNNSKIQCWFILDMIPITILNAKYIK